MLKVIAGVIILIIIVGGGYFLLRGTGAADTGSTATATTTVDATGGQGAQATTTAGATATTGQATTTTTNSTNKVMDVTLHTNKGDITIAFYPEQAPKTVANFIKLAQSGFYTGTKFHRVIKGFMIQGGDPLSKDDSQQARWGTGGPGYAIPDEITPTNSNVAGSVAMANSGPNSAGSQFYINAVDNPTLNQNYTVFGHVTAGMDVVTAIDNVATDPSNDRPLQPVIIESVTVQ